MNYSALSLYLIQGLINIINEAKLSVRTNKNPDLPRKNHFFGVCVDHSYIYDSHHVLLHRPHLRPTQFNKIMVINFAG